MEALSLGNERSEQKGLALCPPVGVADQGSVLHSSALVYQVRVGQGYPGKLLQAAGVKQTEIS